jgi:hypothetical protein
LAPWSSDGELTRLVERLRADGRSVIYELPGSDRGPVGARIVRVDGAWQLQDAG